MLWCKEKSLNHIPFDENKTLQKEKSTAIFLKNKQIELCQNVLTCNHNDGTIIVEIERILRRKIK